MRFAPTRCHPAPAGLGLALVLALAGTLGGGPASAQVRISEIFANPTGTDAGFQKAELTNYGPSTVTIGGLRICVQFFYATIPAGTTLDSGESYTIHIRMNGSNDANNWYVPSPFPPLIVADDSFGLYKAAGAFTDPNAMLDYVEWGAGGQPRENVAVSAGLWPLGQFVPVPTEGSSLQLCDELSHAPGGWISGTPTLGAANACAEPKPLVVLSEVQADPMGDDSGFQRIEIRNLDVDVVDVSGFEIAFETFDWALPPGTSLDPGEHLVVHLNASGTDDDNNKYTGPLVDMAVASNGLGLYLPVELPTDLDNPDKILDFVQWGAAGQARESVADAAGVWNAGEFMDTPAEANSLERCSPNFGILSWSETPDHTFGADNSCNPTDVPPGPRVTLVGPPVPNPMWECSIVRFELSAPAHVVARVRDVRGRLVNVLADQEFTAGPQVVVWEGDDRGHAPVGPGVYFLELSSSDARGADGAPFRQSVRMVRARH